jgi:hypothetical protein
MPTHISTTRGAAWAIGVVGEGFSAEELHTGETVKYPANRMTAHDGKVRADTANLERVR